MAASAGAREKPILGPAAAKLGRGPDLSQLRSPIQTSLSGTRQVVHALESGTREVKTVLLDEINLMYECKVCYSVFRSIANLVAHKRTFCKAKYKDVHHIHQDKYGLDATEMQTVVVEPELDCVASEEEVNLDDYSPSYELLKVSGVLQDIFSKPVVNRLLPAHKAGLDQVVSKLKSKLDGTEAAFYAKMNRNFEAARPQQTVHLEPMFETDNALYQSWRYSVEGETVGETHQAWAEAEENKKHIQINPNGQVSTTKETIKLVTGPDGKTYSVKIPLDAFNSAVDAESDDEEAGYTKYPCPKCKKTFVNIMNVFSHMVKFHDVTMQEAKTKRKKIQNNAVYVEGKRTKNKVSGYMSRPVKPVLVKVKNFTLNAKVPMNLCNELHTEGNTTCPVLSALAISDSAEANDKDLEKAEEMSKLIEEREEAEQDDVSDLEVDRKIMEYVNRRRVECRVCGEQFGRTYLVRSHVAEHHLQMKRWRCNDCNFGTWSRAQCIRHAAREHGSARAATGGIDISRQAKQDYFDLNPLCKVNLLDPAQVPPAPASALGTEDSIETPEKLKKSDEERVKLGNGDNNGDLSVTGLAGGLGVVIARTGPGRRLSKGTKTARPVYEENSSSGEEDDDAAAEENCLENGSWSATLLPDNSDATEGKRKRGRPRKEEMKRQRLTSGDGDRHKAVETHESVGTAVSNTSPLTVSSSASRGSSTDRGSDTSEVSVRSSNSYVSPGTASHGIRSSSSRPKRKT